MMVYNQHMWPTVSMIEFRLFALGNEFNCECFSFSFNFFAVVDTVFFFISTPGREAGD